VAAAQVGVRQYKAGTIPFNTVFNLETTQVLQQDNLALAQGNIALNLINVYRYLGGGWEVRYARENVGDTPTIDAAAPEAAPAAPRPEALPAPRPQAP
jgi:hypothetical protein